MMKGQPTEFEPVAMDSEDDLFIAYTSGTTNRPRRIVHSQAGFVLLAAFTHKVHVSLSNNILLIVGIVPLSSCHPDLQLSRT